MASANRQASALAGRLQDCSGYAISVYHNHSSFTPGFAHSSISALPEYHFGHCSDPLHVGEIKPLISGVQTE